MSSRHSRHQYDSNSTIHEERRERKVQSRKPNKVTTRSVETQTEENSFCLCFIPEYVAKANEDQELDPRIKILLDQLHDLTEGKVTCAVRNFEKNQKWTPKQRWKISGRLHT